MKYQQDQIQNVITGVEDTHKGMREINTIRMRITSLYESTKTMNITLEQLKQIQEILK